MRLFSSPTSPYARKVRIIIAEYALEDEISVENHAPMENPAALHAANPIGKVPTLITADGTTLYDSPVICEYLDAMNGSRFVPPEGKERWDCLRRQALGDGVLDAAFSRTMERQKPESQRSDLWLERWEQGIRRALDVMSRDLEISGDRFDLGDISAGCALGYLDLRHADLEWRKGRASLTDWFDAFSGRPSARATTPPAA